MKDLKIFTTNIEDKAKEQIECACGCGEIINIFDKYGRQRKYISGHNGRKYEEKNQHKREWNHRNRRTKYLYKKQFVAKRKLELISMLGRRCKKCGIKATLNNLAIFDFHHRNPEEKSFNLGQNTIGNKSFENIKNEAKKCDVLCSNCHRLHHYLEEYNKSNQTNL